MKRRPFSQVIVLYCLIGIGAFIFWCCYEMHTLHDLSPLAYIAAETIAPLSLIVGAYMWRAKQSDQFELDKQKSVEYAEFRKKYGSNFRDEHVVYATDDTDYNYSADSVASNYTSVELTEDQSGIDTTISTDEDTYEDDESLGG